MKEKKRVRIIFSVRRILNNVGTIVSFRLGLTDAEIIAKEFYPVFSAKDLISLPNYHIYLRLMIDGVVSQPFSGETVRNFDRLESELLTIATLYRFRKFLQTIPMHNKIIYYLATIMMAPLPMVLFYIRLTEPSVGVLAILPFLLLLFILCGTGLALLLFNVSRTPDTHESIEKPFYNKQIAPLWLIVFGLGLAFVTYFHLLPITSMPEINILWYIVATIVCVRGVQGVVHRGK